MSIVSASDGRRLVLEKKRRLRDHEVLAVRDRDMWRKRCEGHSLAEIGREFRISEGLVSRRLSEMPHTIKQEIKRDVTRIRVMRIQYIQEDMASASA